MKIIKTWAIVNNDIIQFFGSVEEVETKKDELNGEVKLGFVIVDSDNSFLVDNLFEDESDALDYIENSMS